MATLTRTSHVLIFEDTSPNRNPARRNVDWRRQVAELPVENPRNQTFEIEPGDEVEVFSGTRTLGVDASTDFDLTLSNLDSSRYRLAWAGSNAAPAFRTTRTVASSPGDIILALNANLTVTVTSSLGSIFGAVVAGDTVLIPGITTGDPASNFNPLNEGVWSVVSASGTTLVLRRAAGTVFQGASESVTVASDAEFKVYGPSGVQANDTLELVAGFNFASLHSYRIVFVADTYVEFVSTTPLAEEAGVVPGVGGIMIYSQAKRYVLVETDQECALKFNGATDESNRIEPILAADSEQVGFQERYGTVFSLSIKNRSTAIANVTFISAE